MMIITTADEKKERAEQHSLTYSGTLARAHRVASVIAHVCPDMLAMADWPFSSLSTKCCSGRYGCGVSGFYIDILIIRHYNINNITLFYSH